MSESNGNRVIDFGFVCEILNLDLERFGSLLCSLRSFNVKATVWL